MLLRKRVPTDGGRADREKRKGLRLLFLLAALFLTGVLILPIPASASTTSSSASHQSLASCAGSGCNGSDPYRTHCAGNGASYGVIASVPITLGGIIYGWDQLWWSSTCYTNWARYSCAGPCIFLTLALFVSQTALQGPIGLNQTGYTRQYYLPTRKANAEAMINCCPAYSFETGYF